VHWYYHLHIILYVGLRSNLREHKYVSACCHYTLLGNTIEVKINETHKCKVTELNDAGELRKKRSSPASCVENVVWTVCTNKAEIHHGVIAAESQEAGNETAGNTVKSTFSTVNRTSRVIGHLGEMDLFRRSCNTLSVGRPARQQQKTVGSVHTPA